MSYGFILSAGFLFAFFKKKTVLTDLELVSKFKESGDSRYVGELYQRYSHFVFGVCRKYLKDNQKSEDAAMQIFEKLIAVLPKHEVSNFKSWLGTMTRNHCLTQLSRSKLNTSSIDEINEAKVVDSLADDSLILEKEQTLQFLEGAVKELSADQRRCIEMFYLEGKSYKEIELESEYDMKQIKSFIQNGKRKLKIKLTEAGINEG